MSKTLRITGYLLLAAMLAGCSGRQKSASVLESYESWPVGISIGVQTPADKMQKVKDAGFGFVEVGMPRKRDMSPGERMADIERFRADAERIGLSVWSIHIPFGRDWDPSDVDEEARLKNVADVGAMIEMTAPLKPQKLVIHASYEPIADEDREAKFAAAVRSLNELASFAEKIGAQLLIEDLPRTCLGNTAEEMLLLMAGTDPSVGVCFDTNHLLKETPQEFARSVGGHIKSLHVSDYDMVDEKHWLMGSGVIDWEDLITAIAGTGYDGVFMFETGGYERCEEVVATWVAMRERLAAAEETK